MINIDFDYTKPFYDFDCLRRLADKGIYKWFIINGIINDGKTYGAKEDMLNQWIKHRKFSIWLMNGIPLLSKELLSFKVENEKNNKEWANVEIKGDKDVGTIGYYNKEPFCLFMSISTATKGGRGYMGQVKNIYYDEFNFMDKRLYNQQAEKWKVLLGRVIEADPNIFLIGNATTLNVPLLYEAGIFALNNDPFEEFMNGEILFHKFKRSKEFIDNKYKGNTIMKYFKRTNYYNHTFDNQYNDNLEKVDAEFLNKKGVVYDRVHNFQIAPDMYVKFYRCFYEDKSLGFMKINKDREINIKYALNRDFVIDGVLFTPDITENIALMFQYDKIWYENITIKQKLYDILKPYFKGIF